MVVLGLKLVKYGGLYDISLIFKVFINIYEQAN